jgi:hypothetical protein
VIFGVLRSRAQRVRRRLQSEGGSYMFCAMYWPLLGGFIAFVILALIMGWIMDPSRHGDADHDRH